MAELGLHQRPLKLFYATSETWMKPSQHKVQWLPVSLSKWLPSLCLPQLFYFDGFCLTSVLYLWFGFWFGFFCWFACLFGLCLVGWVFFFCLFVWGLFVFPSAAFYCFLVLTDHVEHTTLVSAAFKSESLPVHHDSAQVHQQLQKGLNRLKNRFWMKPNLNQEAFFLH